MSRSIRREINIENDPSLNKILHSIEQNRKDGYSSNIEYFNGNGAPNLDGSAVLDSSTAKMDYNDRDIVPPDCKYALKTPAFNGYIAGNDAIFINRSANTPFEDGAQRVMRDGVGIPNGEGVLDDKDSGEQWCHPPPISSYKVQYDSNPRIIRKHTGRPVANYRQKVSVRYLQPPPPPRPGPIIIKEVVPHPPPSAPPVVIRQRCPEPKTPPPLILREKPPLPPFVPPPQVITKRIPPPPLPPRQVILERYPPYPPKPRDIIIEKWLPYKPPRRRQVILKKAQPQEIQPIPKNVIIQYVAAEPKISKKFKQLGVVEINPYTYLKKHGSSLLDPSALQDKIQKEGLLPYIKAPFQPQKRKTCTCQLDCECSGRCNCGDASPYPAFEAENNSCNHYCRCDYNGSDNMDYLEDSVEISNSPGHDRFRHLESVPSVTPQMQYKVEAAIRSNLADIDGINFSNLNSFTKVDSDTAVGSSDWKFLDSY